MTKRVFVFGDDPRDYTGFAQITRRVISVLEDEELDIIFAGRNTIPEHKSTQKFGWWKVTKDKKIYKHGYFPLRHGQFPGHELRELIIQSDPDIFVFHEDLNLVTLLIHGTTLTNYPGCYDLIKDKPIIWIGPYDSVTPYKLDLQIIKQFYASMPYTEYGKTALGATHSFRLGPSIPVEKGIIEREVYGKKFLTVGAHRPKKNIWMIVKWFGEYRKNVMPDAELYIKTSYAGMNDNLKDLNIEQHGIFVNFDKMSDQELSMLYKMNDTYICATPNEGWGLPVTNATHYNMHIIAPDFPVMDEATGGVYTKIPVMDFTSYDGYRTIPIPAYATLPMLMVPRAINNLCIDYWEESVNKFRQIIKELI